MATKLRPIGIAAQTGASASSVAPPAEPFFAPAAASSAEQPTSTAAANGKRSLDSASAGQLGRDSKVPQVGAAALAASSSAAAAPSLKAALPPHSDAQASAAQHADGSDEDWRKHLAKRRRLSSPLRPLAGRDGGESDVEPEDEHIDAMQMSSPIFGAVAVQQWTNGVIRGTLKL